jgi:hypothetical protein
MRSAYSDLAYSPSVHTDPSVLITYKQQYVPKWLGYFNTMLQVALDHHTPATNCCTRH